MTPRRANTRTRTRPRTAAEAAGAARRRVSAELWPVIQQTVAATVSWWIARHVIDHHQPIFAPITTLIALNATRGERGTNAVRFVLGVAAGILVAQAVIAVMGGGYGSLTAAVFVSMLVALTLGGERVTLAQAAVSAILAVATGSTQNGFERLVDVLLGAGVALLFSQLLFPVEPLRLLRRAESDTLDALADALACTARDLERDQAETDDRTTKENLRAVYTQLTDLGRTRDSSGRAARRSPLWWKRRRLIVRESENAARIYPLAGSCLVLTRTAQALDTGARPAAAEALRNLSGTLRSLARAPGDPVVRRHEGEQALGIAAGIPRPSATQDSRCNTFRTTARMAAFDIMVFAGADPTLAARARREGSGDLDITAPPAAPRNPFGRRGGRRER